MITTRHVKIMRLVVCASFFLGVALSSHAMSIIVPSAQDVVLDGILGPAEWGQEAWTPITRTVWGGPTAVTGYFKTRWDNSYFYAGINVSKTAALVNSNPDYKNNDSVELYFDMDHNRSVTYQPDDFQYGLTYGKTSVYEINGGTRTAGVAVSSTAWAWGYSMEVAIPWTTLGKKPAQGSDYGFDVEINDALGATRQAQLAWNGTYNNWVDTSGFGDAYLGLLTATASCGAGINVDGTLNDSAWPAGTWNTVTVVTAGSGTGVYGYFKTRWDSTYLYCGVRVVDPIINSGAAIAWNNSSIEINLDMDHNRSTTYLADDFQYNAGWDNTVPWEKSGRIAGVLVSSPATADGYSVELAIPWTTLGKVPAASSVYGFNMGINACHTPGKNNWALNWDGVSNNSNDTSGFGDLVLGPACTTPTLTPTITPSITPVPAGALRVSNYDLMPASVSTGQQDVYSVMFTINNPSAGIALIKGLTLTVKDSASVNINASSALSMLGIRDEVSYFYNAVAPALPYVYCPVPAGIQIDPYSSKNIYVVADITGNTLSRAQDFKVEISSDTDIWAEDFVSSNTLPVSAEAGYAFPLESSVAVIQNRATELSVSSTDTMPASISTGQLNVRAMELQFADIGNTMTASIKVSRISITMHDSAGNTIPASSAIKGLRITSRDGSFIYGEAAAGASSKLTIVLSAPLIVPSTQMFTCAVALDVSDTLNAATGRVSLVVAGDLYAVDANSADPVIVSSLSPFPKQSGAAVIQERVSDINLDNFTALLPLGVVKGQKWVELFDFRIYDTLGPQSAQAHFNSLTITVKNSLGAAAPSNASVEKFYITDNAGNTLGNALTGVGSETYIALSSPHVFTSGLARYFRLFADILPTAYAPNFKVALQAAGNISITDANSGYEAAKIAAPALPWETGPAGIFMAPATDLNVWHNGNVAPTMAGMGQPDVKFMTLSMHNPGSTGTADIMISGVILTVVDGGNNTVAPSTVLENVYVTNIAGDIIHANYYAVSATAAAPFYVPFSTPIFVDALNTKNAYISGDIALYATQGVYRVRLAASSDFDRLSVPEGYVTATAANADSFPMDSNPVTITALAYNFKAGHRNLMPVSVARGSAGVEALAINFENYNAVPIAVTSLAVSIKDCAGALIAANSVMSGITILDRDNNTITAATPGASGRINISPFNFNVPSGAEKEMKISVDVLSAAAAPFYLELESGSDVSTLPLASVNPVDGDFFGNMKSGCVSIQVRDLVGSFHLFPNPFTAGVEPAHIEYYLEHASEVTIRVFTMEGRLVKEIANRAARDEGLHYGDTWNGKNESGQAVRSGIYLCVLEVKNTASGTTVMIKEKVAVLR